MRPGPARPSAPFGPGPTTRRSSAVAIAGGPPEQLRSLRRVHESGMLQDDGTAAGQARNRRKQAQAGERGGGPGGQSAKDKSRAQSRPVTGKDVAKKSGGAGGAEGGNTPRPGWPARRPHPEEQPDLSDPHGLGRGRTGHRGGRGVGGGRRGREAPTRQPAFTAVTPAPAGVVHDVTNIPMSVYNTVGINSTGTPVSPPTVLKGQPPLTINGKSPSMLYYGAEYCPYCAAERWGMTAALSRFGTITGLKITASSHTDVFPETHTFSYAGATYTSPYIHFFPIEQFTTTPTASGYTVLQNPTAAEKPSSPSTAARRTWGPGPAPAGASPSRSSTSTTWPCSPGPATPGDPGRRLFADRRRAQRPEQQGDPGHRGHRPTISRRPSVPPPKDSRARCARAPA